MWVCESARTSESLTLQPQNFGLQVEGRFSALELTTEGGYRAGGVARARVSQRSGRSPTALDSMPAGRATGVPAPLCLCAQLGAGTPARGPKEPRKCQEFGRGAGDRGGNAPAQLPSREEKKK